LLLVSGALMKTAGGGGLSSPPAAPYGSFPGEEE